MYVVKILYLCRGKREIVGENQDAGCGGAFIFLQKKLAMLPNKKRCSFVKMNDEEVKQYGTLLAWHAANTMQICEQGQCRKMTYAETELYASAVSESILYFNKRDATHAKAMRYRQEMEEYSSMQELACARKNRQTEVIVI